MTPIDINGLLAQMRSLSSQLEPGAATVPASGSPQAPGSFGSLLEQSIAEVSQSQGQAQQLSASFERGDPSTNLPQVMLAVEKAKLSFSAMNEVRNKLVSAYTDIMNMPV